MIVKMFKEFRRKLDEYSKLKVITHLECIKKDQTEMKTTIMEIKNKLGGINIRLDDTEEQIRDLEDRLVEITEAEQEKKKNRDRLRDLWYNIKHTNILIIRVPEGEAREREGGTEDISEEILTENFPNLGKEIHIQETQKVPYSKNPKRST